MATRKHRPSKLSAPDQRLRAILTKYPNLHQMVLTLREGKGVDLPNWPDWCLLPMSGWIAIATKGQMRPPSPEEIKEANCLAAIGTWMYSRGIYELHEEITAALIQTPLTDAIPSDALMRLPEWCLFVRTPLTLYGEQINGFWIWNEWDTVTGKPELRFLVDDPTSVMSIPLILPLGNWSVKTAMQQMIEKSSKFGNLELSDKLMSEFSSYMTEAITPLLNIALYLCSEKPDIIPEVDPVPSPSHPSDPPGKRQLIPAERTHVHLAGHVIGERIRQARELPDTDGSKKRAHLRRGHWHGYWYGSRQNPDDRRFAYKWLHPMIVGGD